MRGDGFAAFNGMQFLQSRFTMLTLTVGGYELEFC